MYQLLTCSEMSEADRRTIRAGTSGAALMARAGRGVAAEICARFGPRLTAVLCGPGNNGGDGFVIARELQERGWPVKLALLGQTRQLRSEAAHHAAKWAGPILPMEAQVLSGAGLAVDAVFGAGLARPLQGRIVDMVTALQDSRVPVVAVDMPSGVCGDTGRILGAGVRADLTVTFARAKPGHYLYPGRGHCGTLQVIDIGITDQTIAAVAGMIRLNHPCLWRSAFVPPQPDHHKYSRGHVLMLAGNRMTGAARLAAWAARRAGAGLLSLCADRSVLPIYMSDLPGMIVREREDFTALLGDPRHNAILLGPGLGVGEPTRKAVLGALKRRRATVLDADALTSFADDPSTLFFAAHEETVLTPHQGEFDRVFGPSDAAKPARVRDAACRASAVIVLKGADTIIAAPDGRMAINANAPPYLATAGSGDVLAGMITGLLAQKMPAFEAAAAAVWMHGAAAARFGPGLIAEDLPEQLPDLLRGIYDEVRGPDVAGRSVQAEG